MYVQNNIQMYGYNFSLYNYNYYGQTHIIDTSDLLVDSADSGRLEESRVQLDELLVEDKLTGVPLLVFANKQDLGMALKADDVSVLFRLF